MPRTLPLVDHPEFSILEFKNWLEYRVENPLLFQAGHNNIQRLFSQFWIDALVVFLIAYVWNFVPHSRVEYVGVLLIALAYVYGRCTQVLWESVVVLPALGIQFETHRGLPSMPLFASRRFVPVSSLQDFIINEGLHGWNVRYYLAVIQRSQRGVLSLEVAFENTLPRFPVLLEVYHGVHETLFDSDNRGRRDK